MAEPQFEVKLATDEVDLLAAQRLRYRVFVEELGGGGELVDHDRRLEMDRFDPFYDHMVLIDHSRDARAFDHVVGVYRLMQQSGAEKSGGFYCANEYDLAPLLNTGRRVLELGRSCLLPDYRGGAAMYHLWNGLAGYISDHEIELLFGVASFHGTDIAALAEPLSLLHHRHLADKELRVKSKAFQPMNLIAESELNRREAMLKVPALIKAYLRLGGVVGEGAFVDHAFKTTDVCLIMDTAKMNAKQRKIYASEGRA